MRLSLWPTQPYEVATYLPQLSRHEVAQMNVILGLPRGCVNDTIVDYVMGSLEEQKKQQGSKDFHIYSSGKGRQILDGWYDVCKDANPRAGRMHQPGKEANRDVCP